ncbi:uncharacterized protein LOC134275268 [Saccostrea cucullata]|uniref:uncharacterized protein LOC134275268 n=1 Tax=Saccostrea cuccullata TaxID=36930 RepID=UPI002ED089BC
MRIYLEVLLFLAVITDFISCCSQDGVEKLVENAHVSCSYYDSCTSECYRGYIFSNGERKTTFKCLNNSWTSTSMACKRVPVVAMEYYTIWSLEVPPTHCNNISQRLQNSKQTLEDNFIDICKYLNIDVNATFKFSFKAFELNTTFHAEYQNASSTYNIDLCIANTKISFWDMPYFRNMLNNITCNGSIVVYRPHIKLIVTKKKMICHQNTTPQNVTGSDMDKNGRELFCEYTSMTTVVTESTSNSLNVCLEIPQILFLTVPAAVILILVTATITALVTKKSNSTKMINVDMNPDDVIIRQIQPTDVEMKDIIYIKNSGGELIENDLYQRTSGAQDGASYSGINDVSTSHGYSLVVKDYNVVRNSAVVGNSSDVRNSAVDRNSAFVRNTTEIREGHLPYTSEHGDTENIPGDYLYSQVQKK